MTRHYEALRYWWDRKLWQSDRDCIVVGSLLVVAAILMAVLKP